MKLYLETEDEKIDYIKCEIKREDKKLENKNSESFTCINKDSFSKIYELLLNTYKLNTVTSALIKTNVIKDNNISFNTEYNYAEDLNFNIDLFHNINTFKYINYPGYFYVCNSESITRKIEFDKVIKNIEAVYYVYARLHSFENDSKRVDIRIEEEILHVLDSLFYANTKIKRPERIKIYNNLNKIINEKKCNTVDMKLIYKKLYFIYDIKSYLLKKIPRQIKKFLMKGNRK